MIVGRTPPDPALQPPTTNDRGILEALASNRIDLDALMTEIRDLDTERAVWDRKIDALDRTLADPALSGHPKRAAAMERRDLLIDAAMAVWSERRVVQMRLWPMVEKVVWLVRRLSPGGRTSCRAVWGEAVCGEGAREDDVYREIDYRAEAAPWKSGTKGYLRGIGPTGEARVRP